MSDRLTAAGEALLRRLTTRGTQDNRPFEAAIRAIEAEAAARAVDEALSVERVAEALWAVKNAADWESVDWMHGGPTDRSVREPATALVAHLRGTR